MSSAGAAAGTVVVLALLLGAAPERTPTPTPRPEPSGTPPATPEEGCEEIEAPVLIHRVEPQYPDFLESQGIEGTVVAHSAITTEGEIADLKILQGPNETLARFAADAFRQWRYEPARCKESGNPVRVYVTQKATFKARHAPGK